MRIKPNSTFEVSEGKNSPQGVERTSYKALRNPNKPEQLQENILQRFPFQPAYHTYHPRLIHDYLLTKTLKGALVFNGKVTLLDLLLLRKFARESVKRDKKARLHLRALREWVLSELAIKRALSKEAEKTKWLFHFKALRAFLRYLRFQEIRIDKLLDSAKTRTRMEKDAIQRHRDKINLLWNPKNFGLEDKALNEAVSAITTSGILAAMLYNHSIPKLLAALATINKNIDTKYYYQIAERLQDDIPPSFLEGAFLLAFSKPLAEKKNRLKEIDKRYNAHEKWRKSLTLESEFLEEKVHLQIIARNRKHIDDFIKITNKLHRKLHYTISSAARNYQSAAEKMTDQIAVQVLSLLKQIEHNTSTLIKIDEHYKEVQKIIARIDAHKAKLSLNVEDKEEKMLTLRKDEEIRLAHEYFKKFTEVIHYIIDPHSMSPTSAFRNLDHANQGALLRAAAFMNALSGNSPLDPFTSLSKISRNAFQANTFAGLTYKKQLFLKFLANLHLGKKPTQNENYIYDLPRETIPPAKYTLIEPFEQRQSNNIRKRTEKYDESHKENIIWREEHRTNNIILDKADEFTLHQKLDLTMASRFPLDSKTGPRYKDNKIENDIFHIDPSKAYTDLYDKRLEKENIFHAKVRKEKEYDLKKSKEYKRSEEEAKNFLLSAQYSAIAIENVDENKKEQTNLAQRTGTRRNGYEASLPASLPQRIKSLCDIAKILRKK